MVGVRNWKWNGLPSKTCGIGLGSTLPAASASIGAHSGVLNAAPLTAAEVPMN